MTDHPFSHRPGQPARPAPPSAVALAAGLGAGLIVASSLVRGGNRWVSLMVVEWLALLLLLALVVARARLPLAVPGRAPRVALWLLVLAPLWVALWHLLPLPLEWWARLPGRADYLALLPLGAGPTDSARPLSLVPSATWSAALAGLPVVAALVLALGVERRWLGRLLKLWVGVAVFQALFGLLQLGPFPGLYFGLESRELIGTFASKNSYSNFLVMTLPLIVWQLMPANEPHSRRPHPRARWLWGAALFVVWVTLLVAMSRTGIATALLVTLLSATLLAPPKARRWLGLPLGFWLLAPVLALALLAGGLDWMARFESGRLIADDAVRALNRASTWRAALDFWPVGAGLGAFAGVFPRYQDASLGYYLVDLAHNDYLQLLMELGAAAVVLALAWLWLALSRGGQLLRASRPGGGRGWQRGESLAVACGLGVLATALHAGVDYPLRIPANAMLCAFLFGVFLRGSTASPQAEPAP